MTTAPIVLTGASGFLARHVLYRLLADGHRVRASLRTPSRADEVRAAVLPQLPPEAAQRLEFVALDLMSDDGWADALTGTSALIHTASPFPIVQPKDPESLIRPAVDGTLRALRAAQVAGVDRVVLTSSTVAVVTPGAPGPLDETRWTDLHHPGLSAYARSKTLAERAAWEFVNGPGKGIRLTAINPGLIAGPVFGTDLGSSAGLIRRIMKGKDPFMPALNFRIVDARDVADMHVRALSLPATEGERILAVSGSLWMQEMGKILKSAYPDRRIPTRLAPRPVLRLLALFDPEIRSILPRLGEFEDISNAKAKRLMGMQFIPPDQAILETARSLIAAGLV
jgi:dihydroflavonol-4-reductase